MMTQGDAIEPKVGDAHETDVIIVGAGPVGLAIALDLGRRGVPSIIVEQKSNAATELLAKADYLNERSMEYCRYLGIRDEVVHAGFPEDVSRDTLFVTSLNGFYLGRLPLPCTKDRRLLPGCREMHRRCPQFWFDPLLTAAVTRQGLCQIQYGSRFESLIEDRSGVQCRIRRTGSGKEDRVRAKYIVACDGLHSSVRRATDISFRGEELGNSLSTIVEVDDLADYHPWGMAERYMFIGPEGVWANLTSVDGRSLYRFTVVGSYGELDTTDEGIRSLVCKAFGRMDINFEIRRILKWCRTQMVASTFAKGRVFLAGDAAHTMSPTGGHGLNTGLGDAMDLSWILEALLRGWGGPSLVDAYTAERRSVAIRNAAASGRNFHVWVDREGRENVLRSDAEAGTERYVLGQKMIGALRQEFESIGIAMGYDYSASPIIVSENSTRDRDEAGIYMQTARAGHRAPHCWLDADVSTLDLFGRSFILLIFDENAIDDGQFVANAAEEVGMPLKLHVISSSVVADLYEFKMTLVRPDGMVAWRGNSTSKIEATLMIDRVRGKSSGITRSFSSDFE